MPKTCLAASVPDRRPFPVERADWLREGRARIANGCSVDVRVSIGGVLRVSGPASGVPKQCRSCVQDKEGDYAGRAGRQACRPFPQAGKPSCGNPPSTAERGLTLESDCEGPLHASRCDYRRRGSTDEPIADAIPEIALSLSPPQSQTGAASGFFAGLSGLIRESAAASGSLPPRPRASPAKQA